jgi:hypothetical protein
MYIAAKKRRINESRSMILAFPDEKRNEQRVASLESLSEPSSPSRAPEGQHQRPLRL